MESTFNILQELVGWVEKFTMENLQEKKDLKDFIVWLNSKVFDDHSTHQLNEDNEMIDMELTFLLIMQNKHYKSYSKKALVNSEITTPDSYSFLYHLNLVDSYRKMELINIHLLEPPSGIEILKRLLKKELIEEFDDIDDKRAKRIKITEKGRKEVRVNMKRMQKVFKTMTAEMSLNEKLHIISFLRNINEYHLKKTKIFEIDE